MNETFTQELAGQISRMYRVALRVIGCADAAQEVTQEACVKALRGAEQFEGRADLTTWLHRITVNCVRDHLRTRRRLDRERSEWDADSVNRLATLETGPDRCAEQKEMYRLALTLVANLPEDCRSAFVLTQMDGYSYDEAAAIENISRGTIASRVYRARKILMEQMNDHQDGAIS